MAQKNTRKSIKRSLSVATATLLSGAQGISAAADAKWNYDTYYLSYAEKDRVRVSAPVISASKQRDENNSLEFKLVFDAMTGASPNGATPTATEQTFSAPSGNGVYTTAANTTPKRDFSDRRVALTVTWQEQLSSTKKNSFSANFSTESDYHSFGLNSTYSLDVNDKLTTLTWGIGGLFDLVTPVGGKPQPMTDVNTDPQAAPQFVIHEEDDEDEGEEHPEVKFSADFLLGLTHILSRRLITQLNYSRGFIKGYLTDPYKLVSVINPDGTPVQVPNTSLFRYLFEGRPDLRNTQALFWKTIFHLNNSILRFSYRHFQDDWGIRSDTFDLKYRFNLGRAFYVQPHYRLYNQSAADFYRHSIFNSEVNTLAHVSADFRLGAFESRTLGVKFAREFKRGGHFGILFERMLQTGDSHPDDAVGPQRQFDLYPALQASIIQFSFSQRF